MWLNFDLARIAALWLDEARQNCPARRRDTAAARSDAPQAAAQVWHGGKAAVD